MVRLAGYLQYLGDIWGGHGANVSGDTVIARGVGSGGDRFLHKVK